MTDTKNWKVIGDSYHNAKSADLGEQIDEMLSRDRQINPHWHGFMQALDTLGLAEMESRHKEVQRLLRENGVTYVVHGEQQEHRPWELDPIPLIISNTDWEVISTGLTQRATLLNLILEDLYGERRLIKDGLIPPEVVYAHAGFLRACVGIIPSGFPFLLNYAADLARGSDGRMWVLGDRTQAPSGAGYALENRTALARALPNLFGEVGVHRLSFFFRSLQNSVLDLPLQYEFGQLGQLENAFRIAPHQRDTPHVVVLTPGPLNETYFEHAYIANYLGYTLVQGDDLTVWDGRVWLKSLGGLRPVDIILRRVDDIFCDPLGTPTRLTTRCCRLAGSHSTRKRNRSKSTRQWCFGKSKPDAILTEYRKTSHRRRPPSPFCRNVVVWGTEAARLCVGKPEAVGSQTHLSSTWWATPVWQ